MRKQILGSLTSLLIPFAAYGAHTGYGAYQRRQSTVVADSQPLPLASRNRPPAKKQSGVTEAAELAIAAGSPVRELVIIDAAVPDKAVLQSAVRPGIETVVLKAGEDALEQTASLLKNHENLDAVHLVSHGEAGAILLGDRRVDKTTLEAHPHFLEALGQATRAGADLLLYGCGLASEDAGLLEVIRQNSHLDVAASSNLTGTAELGGDWVLEIQEGDIETAQAFSSKALRDFSAVLQPFGTKTFESWSGEYYSDDPSRDWDGFTTYISTPGTYQELLSGTVCSDDLYVSMYDPSSQFFIRSNPAGGVFGITGLSIRAPDTGGNFPADEVSIYGYEDGNPTAVGTKSNVPVSSTETVIDLTTGITGSFADIVRFRIDADNTANDKVDFCLMSVDFSPLDNDGNLTAAGGVTEPVGLDTTVDSVGEAVNVFDFTLSDGGTSDGQPLSVSQIVVNVSGTSTDAERGQITWRLNGPDAGNVTGTYNAGSDTITFSGLSISVADGGSDTYTINAYYNDNTGLTEDRTIILSVDGDTDLTVGAGGTQMGSTTAVTNGTGSTTDVVATQLAFTTQPAGSVSGNALTTQPVVAARDAFGNTDVDFTETITLTESSAGTLSNNTQAATGGVATFTSLAYTATADQESFTLTANDQDGAGSNLPTVDANAVTSDVVATKLLFTTQPAPTTVNSGATTSFTTVPVVSAADVNDIVDTGYATDIALAEVNGAGSATMSATGDTDGNAAAVTITPSSGVSTFTDMQITYTASGGSNEAFNLRASSGGLTTADSSQLTAVVNQVPTDIALSSNSINQSSTGAAVAVGILSTTDADSGDTHTYSLVANGASGSGSCGAAGDDDNTSFQIDNANDELETAGSLAADSYSVCIQTSDGMAGYQESFTITVTDDVSPTVTSVSVPGDGTYTTGENLDFTVNASENVTVNTAGGTPRISLTVGATTRYATYISGSGSSALVFRYIVQAGDLDEDGIAVAAALDANGGTVRDGADNDLNTNLNSVGATAGVLVDAVAPSGHSVSFDDGALNGTEAASTSFTFSSAEVGADYSYTINSSGGGTTVTGTGTVTSAGEQISGIDVSGLSDGTLTLSVTLTDAAGNSASAVTDTATLDTGTPTGHSVSFDDGAINGTEASSVSFTFASAEVGADYSYTINSSGGGITVTGTGTVTSAGEQISGIDVSGLSDGTLTLSVTLTDSAGNSAGAVTDTAALDASAPSGHSVSFDDGALNGSEASSVSFTFASAEVGADYSYTISSSGGGTPVTGTGTIASAGEQISGIDVSGLSDGTLTLSVTLIDSAGNSAGAVTDTATLDASAPSGHSVSFDDGTLNGTEAASTSFTFSSAEVGADYSYTISSSGGGTPVTGTGTVTSAGEQISGVDVSGLSDGTLTLSMTLTDAVGNSAGAVTDTATLDTQAPSVGSVTLPADATYTGGQNLDFTVNYDEAVTVTGTPRLELTIGGTTRYATYIGGSGTTALAFRYTVQADDNDTDGIALNTTLDANGGTLRDTAGNNGSTALSAVGSLAGVLVDTQGPSVSSVTLPADGVYLAGQNLDVTVNYDEAVTVNTAGGTPRLVLTIGSTTRYANYVSGSGGTALVFRYTVQAGDNDNDGIALNTTLETNGGSLQDATNNDANVGLGTIGNLDGVLVDTQAPSVDSVNLPANGNYRSGQNLDFTVNYDEVVTVTGTPRLELTIGGTTRYATYTGGSGTAALLFRYTVQSGDSDSDGIALNTTLDANGGTLRDVADNDAATDLGTIDDLSAVLVDTQAPSITSVSLPGDATYLRGQNIDVTVNYDENVVVTGTPRLVLTIGATTRYANYTGGSGTSALLFRYTVQTGDRDSDGIDLNATLDDNGGTVRDAAGNDADTGLGAIGSLAGVLVDALDTDGDGVTDLQEDIDGTDPNDPDDYLDTTDPAITAPADITLDADALYTTVTMRQLLGLSADATDNQVQQTLDGLATDNIDGTGCCEPTPLEVSNGIVRLRPGNNTVTWQAADRKGNTGTDTQTVQVRPLVSISKDQFGVEGGSVSFKVLLNGLAIVYPFDVPFVIDGSGTADAADHDLVAGNVTFTAGQTEVSQTVNLTGGDQPEGDETLVIELDDGAVNTGVNSRHVITITENNVAPDVALSLQQNGVNTGLVATSDGNVTVTANVTDPNTADTHTYDWSGTDSQLVDIDGDMTDTTFVFDPAMLNEGIYNVRVFVEDDNAASDTTKLTFRVVTAAPVLDTSDTDGDGVDDVTEGTGDSDGDGIPDYLDNIGASNILPETADTTDAYLIECEPGLLCRLGRFALQGSTGGARLDDADLDANDDIIGDTDFTRSGGIFDFEVHNLPVAGQSVRVAIPLTAAIPASAVYRKFQDTLWASFVEDADNVLHSAPGQSGYCPPPGAAAWEQGLVEGYYCVQLTIEDGGPNDADGLANGVVEDPGTVGVETATEPGTGDGGGDNDGTTTVNIRSKVDGGGGAAGWPGLLMLALAGLLRTRRRGAPASLGGVILLLVSSQSQAIDWDKHLKRSYVGLDIYQAEGSHTRGDIVNGLADDSIDVSVQNYDASRTAYQLLAGYAYHDDLAVEAGYLDLGEVAVDLTATTADPPGLSAALANHYPISGDGWTVGHRIHGRVSDKLGVSLETAVFFWDGNVEIESIDDADLEDGTDPLLGLTLQYRFDDRFTAGVHFKRVFFDDQEVDVLGSGLSWRF